MNEHTAEDFKNANIAIRGTRGAARRCEPGTPLPWVCDGEEWDDDKGMVEDGWRPVHEHNPHATDALEEEIQDLRDRLNAMVEENICRRSEAAQLTLDSLREAWENAEVPTEANPIREGDLVIYAAYGGFYVGRAEGDAAEMNAKNKRMPRSFRILHRAPQPEPWQALADVMRQWDATPETGHSADSMARWFYERGVRVTGGDET